MTAKIIDLKSGDIAVLTPYNAMLVAECKRRMGRWGRVNLSEGTVNAWILDASHKVAMQQWLNNLFPTSDQFVEKIIKWTTQGGYARTSPAIDGYDLIYFSRDSYSFRKQDVIRVLEIIENTLETGGSRNNPRLYGSITLRLRVRSNAQIAATDDWSMIEL